MPAKGIILSSFGGIVPRHTRHQLPPTQALIARDAKLANGILEPWREPCLQTTVSGTPKMMYVRGNHLHTWDKIVQVAEVSPDWNRFFITGRNNYPEMVKESCQGVLSYQRLGVPTPTEAPTCEGSDSCGTNVNATCYCYTYVNEFGEESAPSPPSNIVTAVDGEVIEVTGIATPPTGYGISAIHLYRAASAVKDTDPKQQQITSAFLYVDAVAASVSSYRDDKLAIDLGFPLETEDIMPPPAKLTGIVAIDDLVRLAGYYENKVYFSENMELHNWPIKYELTLDDMIVHMEQAKQTLFITTGSYPYIIRTINQEGCSPVLKSRSPFPDIACEYPHSHLMTDAGLIYVTLKGLALLGFDGTVKLLTTSWYDPDEWIKILPHTARLGLYERWLFCTTDNTSFILDLWGDSFSDMKGGELVFISDFPKDYFRSNTGDLYLLNGSRVLVWDKGTSYRNFYWESNNLSLQSTNDAPRSIAFAPTSAKVKSKSVKFSLVRSLNDAVCYTRDVSTEQAFRLPRVGRNNYYRIILQGNQRVEFVSLGTSHFTVNDGN